MVSVSRNLAKESTILRVVTCGIPKPSAVGGEEMDFPTSRNV